MPGKSKKGGGLKSSPVYKKQAYGKGVSPFTMKYKRSAFPFKESPIKLDEGTHYVPFEKGPFNPGQSTELPGQRTVPEHSHSEYMRAPDNVGGMGGRPEWY